MDILSAVSETALITLKSRVVEAEKEAPVLKDEMAKICLARLRVLLPPETRTRVLDRHLPVTLTRHIALRARQYDTYTKAFLADNPDGLVVSLGCGFDTRYWRISDQPWPYVEVDLPAVIKVKREVLADMATYRLIGGSVLDEAWLEEVSSIQIEQVLFLAEGLLMYLPKPAVIRLFQRLAERFSRSQIVFEVVNEKYTKGFWKKSVESKMRRNLGSEAGASYRFGLREAAEIEGYAAGLQVVEEWSYFEDRDIIPRFLRLFRHFKLMTRTQWTITATID